MSDPAPSQPASVQQELATAQRDRARDQGRFNMYGMRIDPRTQEPDRANPGNGDHARRFGAGGDLSTYANRSHEGERELLPDRGSDAPAHKSIP
ncbi:hypothetical protein [Melaminivora sp.]|uniref:hypothetical protein n=1 Tax=Melaminivora sp. TaxID=1933032 RepID=UPI0028A96279|nr:hypothetical protein [Melaminivora sp.]